MVHNICEKHSIASKYLAHLRDIDLQKDRSAFRNITELLGGIFAYEISKTFRYDQIKTETPLGTAISHVPSDEIALLTILRAGLPLHQGMLNVLGDVANGFIAAQRIHHKDGSFNVNVEYITSPDIEGRTVILCDPMLATGSSMSKALEAIHEIGQPRKLHIVTIIAAKYGLNYIRRLWPKAQIWVAAVDEELTAKSYIVPGLGDAGDLAYGGKGDNE
jgi:uracil phosphoribosyltransferase